MLVPALLQQESSRTKRSQGAWKSSKNTTTAQDADLQRPCEPVDTANDLCFTHTGFGVREGSLETAEFTRRQDRAGALPRLS